MVVSLISSHICTGTLERLLDCVDQVTEDRIKKVFMISIMLCVQVLFYVMVTMFSLELVMLGST